MTQDQFTVLLDKREGHKDSGLEIGDSTLRGRPIYKEGSTGLADSIQAVQDAGLIAVPTYMLINGRAFANKDDPAWSQWHDTHAERITALDEKGILGPKQAVYALDIQNGGLFVWNPQRIRKAVKSNKLVNYALQLEQDEINLVLDAIKRDDTKALKQLVHGQNVAFAGNYEGFLEASKAPNFIQGLDTTYLVIRPATEAQKIYSGTKAIEEQRENPDLIIASGGKKPLEKMLDQAQGFGRSKFGSYHDGYQHNNTGRVVLLDWVDVGLLGGGCLGDVGRSVGVAPQALDAFYKGKLIDPLSAKIAEAVRTARPVPHSDGVILYVPSVQLRE